MVDKVSVSFPDWMLDEIDERSGNVPRSVWVQQAVQARLNAEDADEWESPEIENKPVPDGGNAE